MGLQIKGYSISGFCIKPTPEYPINVQYLVVAGGGGGGLNGGGGAGGFRTGIVSVNASNVSTVLPVVVGSGGVS